MIISANLPSYSFDKWYVFIESANTITKFYAEVARTPEQMTSGLMNRAEMGDDEAMLFFFESPKEVSMWMKDTVIALDIIFVSDEGKITKIVKNAEPLSVKPISSDFPVKGVLEVKAGICDKLNIGIGDKVIMP